jgi:hypothetical protein
MSGGQTSISAFFAPAPAVKAGKSSDTALVVVDSSDEDAGHATPIAPARKRRQSLDEGQRSAKRSKVDRWRFDADAASNAVSHERPTAHQPDDGVTLPQQASRSDRSRHDAFVAKLLGPRPSTSTAPAQPTLSKTAALKYTPLEKQYLELKKQNAGSCACAGPVLIVTQPGVLLIVEVGYKFCFYGEDAVVASKLLNVAHFFGKNMYTASTVLSARNCWSWLTKERQ